VPPLLYFWSVKSRFWRNYF